MLKIKCILAGIFAISLVSGPAGAQVASGGPAPGFTLMDTNGQKHSLSDYKGQWVVLEWFNPDCPFVKKHYESGNIPRLQKEYTAKGVVWLSIDSSAPGKEGNYPPDGLNTFMTANSGGPTAIFTDVDGKVGRLYGAQTTPHMFVIGPKQDVVYQGAIDDIPSADTADLKTARNYVSAALDAAMSARPISVNTTKSYGCSVKY